MRPLLGKVAMPDADRDPAAHQASAEAADGRARHALTLMVEALRLIDEGDGADVAGAHLDLAIHRLREWIEKDEAR